MGFVVEETQITKRMYGWSKYGGGRYGLKKEELEEWYCQVCKEKQVKSLPSYMFSIDGGDREWVRVCVSCKHSATVNSVQTFTDLIKIVRPPEGLVFKVANLTTLTSII